MDGVGLEVGRFAVRTFLVGNSEINSIFAGRGHWVNGVCEARCMNYGNHIGGAPVDNCDCGIYGSLTYGHLRSQYCNWTDRMVAIIAVEGRVIIGDKGLRAQYARVVAYWCPWYTRKICRTQLPDAQRYRNVNRMLREYGIPKDITEDKWIKLDSGTWTQKKS